MINLMKYLAILLITLFLLGSLILLNTIYPVLPGVANTTKNLGQAVAENWRGFLANKQGPEIEPVKTPTTDEEIENRIREEVERAVAAKLANMTAAGAEEGGGALVVLPPGQSSTTVEDIASSFSDEVRVVPDVSGRSGVITPVFRSGVGQGYLYILTPLKQ